MSLTIKASASKEHKHELDVTSLVFNENTLYSGADDGKIKIWDEDLKLKGQVQAHPCSIFSLAIGNDTLYSCSNDGTVKAWSLDALEEKETVLRVPNEIWKICYNDGKLYVGDDEGIVKIFVNNNIVGILEIMHPITDLIALNNLVYTARDLYVIISEVYPEAKKISTIKAIQGRAPMCVLGDKLCFPSRTGRAIHIHQNSKESEFKEVVQIQDAHEMIINALCGMTGESGTYLFTGGWDKLLKKWKIVDNSPYAEMIDDCLVDMCITALTNGKKGKLYVGGGDGTIFRVDVQP